MAWYDEARFYHIYPLGLTGAPQNNDYGEPVNRMKELTPWIKHIKEIGCNAIYIGPLFQSGSHGYDTTDYKLLDSKNLLVTVIRKVSKLYLTEFLIMLVEISSLS